MNNLKNSAWLLTIALLAGLTACKKYEVSPTSIDIEHATVVVATIPVTDYFPMTIGSYWIYEVLSIDTLGIEGPVTHIDTVTIIGDTVINGNTFMVFDGSFMTNSNWRNFYRDSSGYIVTNYGGTALTNQPTTDTLASSYIQSIGWQYKYMSPPPPAIATPVCTFTSLLHTKTDLWTDDPNYPWGSPRSDHGYFAEGVGNVLQIFYYYSSPSYLHRRLTEYYIAP